MVSVPITAAGVPLEAGKVSRESASVTLSIGLPTEPIVFVAVE